MSASALGIICDINIFPFVKEKLTFIFSNKLYIYGDKWGEYSCKILNIYFIIDLNLSELWPY